MLGKMLKYEIPALGRKLVPLYIGWAVTAIMLGIAIGPLQEKSTFMLIISALLYTGVATAVFVMAIVMIVLRYSNSLLGDEGYFNHVLPVSATHHIANKTISSIVWIVISCFALCITGIIIVITSGSIRDFFSIDWAEFFAALGRLGFSGWFMILEFLILFVVSIAKSILAVYAALTVGHQARKRTTLASIGAYIAALVFETTVGRIVYPIFSGMVDMNSAEFLEMQKFFLVSGTVTIIIGGVYFFICKYLMENKLNLN